MPHPLDAAAAQPAVPQSIDASVRAHPLDAGLSRAPARVDTIPIDSSAPGQPPADAGALPEDLAEVEPDASSALGATMATRDSAYLFEPSQLRTFELFLHHADLATLDADPTAEKYVPGQLVFEGGLIPNVGIRYKGSTGAFLGCVSGGLFPPSGAKTCVKLGIKVKLDFGAKNTRFFGQKKLQFHAMNLDRSLLRERFAYGLFNESGVAAPRTMHVRLLINGKLVGVFLLVEVIEEPFMQDRFDDHGAGNLYKEVWPISGEQAPYLTALEATGTKPAHAAKIAAFASEVAVADDTSLPDVLARWVDLDHMASYVAVDRAIRHDDGPFHWYCGDTVTSDGWRMQRSYAGERCGNHNYFWYEEALRNRLWIVPWDLDTSIPVGQGLTGIVSRWDDLNPDCSMLLPAALGPQMPITCDPLQRALALSLRQRVSAKLGALIAGPLSEERLDATLTPWISQLEPAVAEAHRAHDSEQDVETWTAQVQSLREALRTLREAAAAL
jgi:hypothetical protein